MTGCAAFLYHPRTETQIVANSPHKCGEYAICKRLFFCYDIDSSRDKPNTGAREQTKYRKPDSREGEGYHSGTDRTAIDSLILKVCTWDHSDYLWNRAFVLLKPTQQGMWHIRHIGVNAPTRVWRIFHIRVSAPQRMWRIRHMCRPS